MEKQTIIKKGFGLYTVADYLKTNLNNYFLSFNHFLR